MRSLGRIMAIAILTACFYTQANATLVVPAYQDSFIYGNTPDGNFGTDPVLKAKDFNSTGTSDKYWRKTYIQFNVGSLDAAPDYKLVLNGVDSTQGVTQASTNYVFNVWGLNQNGPSNSWDENTITWNNAPLNDTSSGKGFLTGAISLGTFNFDGSGIGEVITFQSEALDTFIGAVDSNNTLTLMIGRDTVQPNSNNTYVHAFASIDNASVTGPTLAAIPEASTLAIWSLLGCIGMIRFGWRRLRK